MANQATTCAPGLTENPDRYMVTTTYVGTYQPAYYAIVGLPTRFLPPRHGVYAARLVSVAMVAALAASALTSARKLGSTVTGATLLTFTPALVFVASTVNAQGPELVAAIAVWTTGLVVLGSNPPTRREVIRLGVAASVLASSRPTGPLLTMIILVVLGLAAANLARLRMLWSHRSTRVVAAVTALVWAASVIHVIATSALTSVMITPRPEGLTRAHWNEVAATVPQLVEDQVALISWHGIVALNLVKPLLVAWFALLASLVVVALVRGTWRSRLIMVAMVTGWITLPLAAVLINHEAAWQGRYGLPLGVGIPILAAWTIERRPAQGRWAPTRPAFTVVAATAVATGLVVAHQQLMSRNLHGQPSPVFAPRSPDLWNGPLNPDLLFLGMILAAIIIIGLTLLQVVPLRRAPHPSGHGVTAQELRG